LAWLAERAVEWRTPFPDWIETRYETKAKREGRTPTYLLFEKRPCGLPPAVLYSR
jgi:tRNA (guanine-N7-)-methyltransferase